MCQTTHENLADTLARAIPKARKKGKRGSKKAKSNANLPSLKRGPRPVGKDALLVRDPHVITVRIVRVTTLGMNAIQRLFAPLQLLCVVCC